MFDQIHLELFAPLLAGYSVGVLPTRGELLNVPVLVAALGRRTRWSEAYFDEFISRSKPRIVITLLDNSLIFLGLKSRNPGPRFVVVQNGWRAYFADIFEVLDTTRRCDLDQFGVDYICAFGTEVGNHYASYIKGEVIPVGSVKNNSAAVTRQPQPDTIAFISQWHPNGIEMNGEHYTQERFFRSVDAPVISFLSRYAETHAKRLWIVPRTGPGSAGRVLEQAYYRELLGAEAVFVEPPGPFPSYQAIDLSAVVVALDTTLGYEALARGRRTAMLSVRSHALGLPGLTYGWPRKYPNDGPFWTNRPDPARYEEILDYLFTATDAEWQRALESTDFDSLMAYDPGNTALQTLLDNELSASV